MHKRLLGLALSALLLFSLAPAALAAESPAVELRVNGVAAEGVQAAVYDGVTYVSLPNLSVLLRPDATFAWDDTLGRVVVSVDQFTITAGIGDVYLQANGRYLYVPGGVQAGEGGDTLVPVRTLAQVLGAQVTWDGAVNLTTGGPLIASGDDFYNAQSVDLIARVIYHESGYQPFKGQLAVGAVILNRVSSASFPGTVYDVVYQSGQFPGATSLAPDAEAVIAAKLCLEGANVVPGAYWFNGAGKPCWASKNKRLIATIGGHAFYG